MATEMEDWINKIKANKPRAKDRKKSAIGRYLQPFVLAQKRENCDNQGDFYHIGLRCQSLLYDCYDFQMRFGLKPDKATEVTATFTNSIQYSRRSKALFFDSTSVGMANVRYKDEYVMMKGQVVTAGGMLKGLVRLGTDDVNIYTQGLVHLDSGAAQLRAGAAGRWEGNAVQAEFDLADPNNGLGGRNNPS
eukprot:comp23767_c5_seq3/m.41184 comp23767_c5_seq3/g.41184  ORF comp23767_c5_seq3/g.41184 comp23767_c5_seq3/m.41184 type:complete len:191 (-) comp23767_c5_seq3:122-694(-)